MDVTVAITLPCHVAATLPHGCRRYGCNHVTISRCCNVTSWLQPFQLQTRYNVTLLQRYFMVAAVARTKWMVCCIAVIVSCCCNVTSWLQTFQLQSRYNVTLLQRYFMVADVSVAITLQCHIAATLFYGCSHCKNQVNGVLHRRYHIALLQRCSYVCCVTKKLKVKKFQTAQICLGESSKFSKSLLKV